MFWALCLKSIMSSWDVLSRRLLWLHGLPAPSNCVFYYWIWPFQVWVIRIVRNGYWTVLGCKIVRRVRLMGHSPVRHLCCRWKVIDLNPLLSFPQEVPAPVSHAWPDFHVHECTAWLGLWYLRLSWNQWTDCRCEASPGVGVHGEEQGWWHPQQKGPM